MIKRDLFGSENMRKYMLVALLVGIFLLIGRGTGLAEKEVAQTQNKIQTTDLLLPFHNSKPRTETITHAVIHFISNAASNPNEPYGLKHIRSLFVDYGVSAHYLIGRDGEIYRLVPEHRVAYHAGKGYLHGFPKYKDALNEYSIGIEMMAIGTAEEMNEVLPKGIFPKINPSNIGYTDAQYDSLNHLLSYLVEKYPTMIRNRWHIVGHDEYAPGRKSDPGILFNWDRIDLFASK
jgi:N-acetyl-anhydromuramyl-L-alanine amidase AmpD